MIDWNSSHPLYFLSPVPRGVPRIDMLQGFLLGIASKLDVDAMTKKVHCHIVQEFLGCSNFPSIKKPLWYSPHSSLCISQCIHVSHFKHNHCISVLATPPDLVIQVNNNNNTHIIIYQRFVSIIHLSVGRWVITRCNCCSWPIIFNLLLMFQNDQQK